MELNYYSHPNRLLTSHITLMSEFFDDEFFKEAVKYHDIGKCSNSFQHYIQAKSRSAKPHALVSGIIFLLSKANSYDEKELFFIYNAIISHHLPLSNRAKITNRLFNLDSAKSRYVFDLYSELRSYDDVATFWQIEEFDIDTIEEFADEWEFLKFDLEDFVSQKLLYSKLIFADKYEAITNEIFKAPKLTHSIEDILSYKQKRGFLEDNFRAKMSQEIISNYQANSSNSIFTITAPTGSGKTLASLELALYIAKSEKRDKIIYSIPFTSIIDQSVEIFREIFKDKKITPQHYLITVDGVDEDKDNIDYDRLNYLLHSWADSFIVSTFYQLFFTILGNKNMQSVKLCNMQNSVIVLDEVQAIPFPLWKPMQSLLAVVAKSLNSTFILMSATMPMVTDSAVELAPKERLFPIQNRYTLRYLSLSSEDKLEELSDRIVEAFNNYGSALCVVNTITNSKLLYKILSSKLDNVYLLNSYMLPRDRKRVIENLRSGTSNKVEGKVLISTQVIEAGVDLDFAVGFREFAPLSSIIQSAGRVNREGKLANATLWVFDNLSTGVYDSILLNTTHSILKDDFNIQEKDILDITQQYFQELDSQISDREHILDDIKEFDFESIEQTLNRLFSDDDTFRESVVIGIDLRELEEEFYKARESIDNKWELKRLKERLFNSFIENILNIKKRDLILSGVTYEASNLFGLYYIPVSEGVYSKDSGFLIAQERDIEDEFFD